MKLSISLIAVALAAIACSAVAAPALYPMERTSFERDVDIYSRGTQSQYTKQHGDEEDKHASQYTEQHDHHHRHQEEDKHAASQYTEQHHRDHREVAKQAGEARKSCKIAMRLAVHRDWEEAKSQEKALTEVERLRDKHIQLSQTNSKGEEHQFIDFDLGIIARKKHEADKVIDKLGPWKKVSYVSPY